MAPLLMAYGVEAPHVLRRMADELAGQEAE